MRYLLTVALLLVMIVAGPTNAALSQGIPEDPCEIRWTVKCEGGGGGDDEPSPPSGPYWGGWISYGYCDWTIRILIERDLYDLDGTLATTSEGNDPDALNALSDDDGRIYQQECWEPTEAGEAVEGQLVEDSKDLSPPLFNRNPEALGLTGLETWLWYQGETQIEPIELTWTDPVNALTFELQGRAWAESITWDMGNGDVVTSDIAATWESSVDLGGDMTNPAATYTYETSAIQAGFAEGTYPVTVTLSWAGEWRLFINGAWSAWTPILPGWADSGTFDYEVTQIRSVVVP